MDGVLNQVQSLLLTKFPSKWMETKDGLMNPVTFQSGMNVTRSVGLSITRGTTLTKFEVHEMNTFRITSWVTSPSLLILFMLPKISDAMLYIYIHVVTLVWWMRNSEHCHTGQTALC